MDSNANKFYIPNILGISNNQDFAIDNIIAAREVRDSLISDWIGEEPVVFTDINNISLDKSRFVVDINSIWYECLFLPNKTSDTLVVSLSGGGRSINNRYPRFLRWKYANKLQANMLCIDDPMYKGNNDRGVRWYYGTKETSYLKEMVPIIKRISSILNIAYENIIFIGSSGGGYAANYLANVMDGTNAISMNPQFLPMNWKNGKIMEIFKQSYDIDLSNMNDIHERNNFIVKAKNSVFLEVINASSTDDYVGQFLPFCKNNNIVPHYGLSHQNNVITWLHCTDAFSLHSANPSDLGLLISISLLRYFRKTHDVSSCYNLSLVLNEELRSKFEIKKELANIQYWKKSLSSMYYNLPDTVITSQDLEKNHVDFFLKKFAKINIKNIYFTLHKTIEKKVVTDEDDDVLKFYYGICIVKEPQLINNESFYKKILDFAEKYNLHIRKSKRNMKLLSSSRKVEFAAKKLSNLIEHSCAELVDIYSQFKLNDSKINK